MVSAQVNTDICALPWDDAWRTYWRQPRGTDHLFTVGVAFIGFCHSLRFPSLAAIYRENYKGVVRGQVVGLTTTTLTIFWLVNHLCGRSLAQYRDKQLCQTLFVMYACGWVYRDTPF